MSHSFSFRPIISHLSKLIKLGKIITFLLIYTKLLSSTEVVKGESRLSNNKTLSVSISFFVFRLNHIRRRSVLTDQCDEVSEVSFGDFFTILVHFPTRVPPRETKVVKRPVQMLIRQRFLPLIVPLYPYKDDFLICFFYLYVPLSIVFQPKRHKYTNPCNVSSVTNLSYRHFRSPSFTCKRPVTLRTP